MSGLSVYDSPVFGAVRRDQRIVYTGGTFDLLHVGHLNLLHRCRQIAGQDGLVIVGLNTDSFITEYKGRPPVNDYAIRELMLNALRAVDAVIPNLSGADSVPTIKRAFMMEEPLMPSQQRMISYWFHKFVVIGSDWANRDYYKQMGFTQEWLDRNRISLLYTPYTPGISTTELRRKLGE